MFGRTMIELRPAVPADADVLTALAHRAKASWGYPSSEAFYLRYGAVRVGAVPAPMPGAPDRALPQLRFTEVASEAASIDGIHR